MTRDSADQGRYQRVVRRADGSGDGRGLGRVRGGAVPAGARAGVEPGEPGADGDLPGDGSHHGRGGRHRDSILRARQPQQQPCQTSGKTSRFFKYVN